MITSKQLKDIELIVFDLDGTLLSENNTIGDDTKRLIPELKKLGVRFSFATGRPHSAITEFAELLKIETPLISMDGTLIKSFPDNKVIHRAFIKEKHVVKAIDLVNKNLLSVALCHDEHIYFRESDAAVTEMLTKYGSVLNEVEDLDDYINDTLEIVVVSDIKSNIKEIEKKLTFPYAMGLNVAFQKSQRYDNIYYLEIRRKGNSKGEGIKKLASRLKISLKKTAVMGDWYNDRSMFQLKTVKVAMNNAIPELKRMADHITTKTNNEDGVGEFLEMVLKAKQSKL